MDELLRLLSGLPGGAPLAAWIVSLAALSSGERIVEIVRVFFQLLGFWEVVKHVYRWIFKRRRQLEDEVEILESRLNERNETIMGLRAQQKQLTAELNAARSALPAAAAALAEREWRERNYKVATGHLEDWLAANAGSLGDIAKRLAHYHIVQAVPEPGNHLRRAGDMLRLARGAAPLDAELQEIAGEFDIVNAALQEQILRDGDTQIAWNGGMAGRGAAQSEASLALVMTFRDIASWLYKRGLWRLLPLFADHASELAWQAGRPHRRVWCQRATDAAHYQAILGHPVEALRRIDNVLEQARGFLTPRDAAMLDGRHVRAHVLQYLGRFGEALAEIDAFAPIEAEVKGERHPDTLFTKYLRAHVLQNLGRSGEALAEIDAFAPIQAEVMGERHPETLTTKHLRASVLQNLGRYGEALAEIDAFAPIRAEISGERHPHTLTTKHLRASVLQNLGRYGEAFAEIDAFAPIQAEVKGERHPDTLSAKYLRASVLRDLGRSGEALAEIDAFAPIEAEVKGERHPDTLFTKYLRAHVLQNLGRSGEALAEIDAFAPIQAEVLGERHPDTLTAKYLRASVLQNLGRSAEALAEIDAFAPIQAEVLGEHHPYTLVTRSLRIGIEIAGGSNIDHTAELRGIIEALRLDSGGSWLNSTRYRLSRLLFQQGHAGAARTEIIGVIADFDPATAAAHILLRSAKALLDMIDGRPVNETLIA